MPLVLDATVGGATSNAYVDRDDANTYFEGRASTAAWDAAFNDAKDKALVNATDLLERLKWAGAKGMTPAGALTQALAWPRRWAPTLEADAAPEFVAVDFIDTSVAYYSELTIPRPIVRACCELALVILTAGTTDIFASDLKRVKRKKVDALETEFFDSQDALRGISRYPHVLQLITPLLRSAGGIEVERV